ncbi:cysteine-rich receptor-like protein kinase 25 [Neltuma alba]|uniref:cysteine-rich receptor-like protein kinase 25 n=1 Tax=Neltuma alba TaxID=207710 RepID=UPI0010A52363|nr:cysteine-rich receptor-like protein kinase 25 [Prosopis alba]
MASMVIMASYKIIPLLFFITFLSSATSDDESQPTFLSHACSSDKTFPANSAFQSDLTTLLSSLASDNTANTDFYNTTVAGGGETAYGLFMCRGDVTLEVCHQCVVEATKRLTSDCQFSKEAVIWYDECMLRYSNTSFFSTVDTRPRLGLLNTGNIANPASFMRLLFTTMNETADLAAKPALGEKKYATKEAFISGFQTLYCLAQCTPDLSPEDCRRCLSGVIGDLNWCCDGKQGGRVLYPSCNVRYELYPFYQTPA